LCLSPRRRVNGGKLRRLAAGWAIRLDLLLSLGVINKYQLQCLSGELAVVISLIDGMVGYLLGVW
jgi:hypothetical protein